MIHQDSLSNHPHHCALSLPSPLPTFISCHNLHHYIHPYSHPHPLFGTWGAVEGAVGSFGPLPLGFGGLPRSTLFTFLSGGAGRALDEVYIILRISYPRPSIFLQICIYLVSYISILRVGSQEGSRNLQSVSTSVVCLICLMTFIGLTSAISLLA